MKSGMMDDVHLRFDSWKATKVLEQCNDEGSFSTGHFWYILLWLHVSLNKPIELSELFQMTFSFQITPCLFFGGFFSPLLHIISVSCTTVMYFVIFMSVRLSWATGANFFLKRHVIAINYNTWENPYCANFYNLKTNVQQHKKGKLFFFLPKSASKMQLRTHADILD